MGIVATDGHQEIDLWLYDESGHISFISDMEWVDLPSCDDIQCSGDMDVGEWHVAYTLNRID